MERCPNCAARADGSAACRRCGMDLAGLLRVERAAETLRVQAVAHLAANDASAACTALTHSLALHRTPCAERLLGFAQGRSHIEMKADR